MTPTCRRGLLVLAAVVVVVGAVACGSGGGGGEAVACPDGEPATPPSGPDALPVATLEVLGADEQVSTACLVGRPLVVNFWAEWCGPCKEEMPALQAVHERLGDRVRFVGIDYEDREAAALAFAEQVGVTYELLADPDGTYFDATRGRAAPYTLLVDSTGTIQYRHFGPVTERSLVDLLAEHLGVAPPAQATQEPQGRNS